VNKKSTVNEIFLIRAFACISVVLLHAIGVTTKIYNVPSDALFSQARLGLLFATPLFIILSEFLLSYSYNEKLPRGFFKKRTKYILAPFVFMALFYALVVNLPVFTWEGLVSVFFINVTGGYHGYFILIIFQFYVLHSIFIKFEKRFSPKWVLLVTFTLNVAYLAFFNLSSPPQALPNGDEIWRRWYWFPFVAWIFYFTLAYYCGKYFEAFKTIVQKNLLVIILSVFLSFFLLYNLYSSFVIPSMSSKRVDILFYTVGLWFLLFYISNKIKKVPLVIMLISKLSFGIYLLHPFYIRILMNNIDRSNFSNLYVHFAFLFFVAIVASGLTTYLLSLTKIGRYFVGSVGKVYIKKGSKTGYVNNDGLERSTG
jgi:membrane-bound acyltransferase YfiQ involved in biofilm formation